MGHLRGRSGSRRRWSVSEKRRIVAEALSPQSRAVDVARRYSLNLTQLYTWCRRYKSDLPANVGGGAIVPIDICEEAPDISRSGSMGVMVISMPSGLRVELDLSTDEVVLRRLFSALRSAG